MNWKRVLAVAGAAILLYLVANLVLGAGQPRAEIAANVEEGKEYPQPGEDQIAQETLQLVRNSVEERRQGGPARRDAHPRAHGCLHGEFRVLDVLPQNLARGVFVANRSYPAWVRFSNGSPEQPKPDYVGDIRGMALKLIGAEGPRASQAEAHTQDFLLINHPTLPVGEAAEYLALFRAALGGHPMRYFIGSPFHWKLAAFNAVRAIRGKETPSMLAIRYWSTTPYRLGAQAVKYSIQPCEPLAAEMPEHPGDRYLRDDLIARMQNGAACFRFMVQVQRDARRMPVEDSSVEWDEVASPFTPVAELHLPAQQFASEAQDQFCENLSFDPWNALEEHRPLGGINRVRRVVYRAIAEYRHGQNQVPLAEPQGDERF
ncbi:MAG: catalase family protein [Leptospirales bacterium]|nr:catalase family protein [Leptospirales bacterium]